MRLLLALLALLLVAVGLAGGATQVASTATGLAASGSSGTTSAIDTSTATFLLVTLNRVTDGGAFGVLSDSKGNTWSCLTRYNWGAGPWFDGQICYVCNPGANVGASHTVSIGAVAGDSQGVTFTAWTGVGGGSSCLVAGTDHGATYTSGALHPGAVTPSATGDLIVSFLSHESNAGTTVTDLTKIGTTSGLILATLSAPNTSSVDPAWSPWSTTQVVSGIAVFTGAGGGGGGGGTPVKRRIIR